MSDSTPLHALDELALIATKTTRAAQQREWTDWLVPHAVDHGGELWRLLDPGPAGRPGAGHSHVLHLPGSRLDDHDHAIATGRGGPAFPHAEITRDHWTGAGDGIVTDADADVTGLIIAHVLSTDPSRTREWDDWYETQHLPDMMGSHAFVSGTRWRRLDPRPGSANHLTIYEVAGIEVEEAIERSAAVMPDLVAQGRKHECHAGGLTWALQRVR